MACGDPRIAADKSSQLEKFVADGNEVVEFKLVRGPSDVNNDDLSFNPDMCHQIFNQSETIFGYEQLRIKLFFTAASLDPYVGISFKSKVSQTLSDGVEADNLSEKLGAVLRSGYSTNLDDFTAGIEKSQLNFKPFGDLVHSFTVEPKQAPAKKSKLEDRMNGHSNSENENGHSNNENEKGHASAPKSYEIYVCDITTPKFKDYLFKMEAFIMWFIDAASFVDADDEKWKFFVMYEKYKSSEGNTMYAFIGYSSSYNFYCFPDLIRPRIAQMVILPPFQRQGLAVELLSCVYRTYRNDTKVKEITVEDPSDDFERLRDFVDARDCSKLSAYSNDKLKLGFSPTMTEEAKKVLKMTPRQARRVYEMLRLKVTNINDEKEFTEYRLDVKRRLNIPYQKQESDMKRVMRRKFNSTELQTQTQLDDATRKTELESNFQLALSHYQYVVNRLERDG